MHIPGPEYLCRRPAGWMLRALLLLVLMAAKTAPVRAQEIDRVKAAQVKAGYLVNFLRHTDYPPDAVAPDTEPYRIVVLGDAELASALKSAARAGVRVNSRALKVTAAETPPEPLTADLLYLSRGQRAQTAAVLAALAGRPVLTVGEDEGFNRAGGMICLSIDGGRIVFDANVVAIRGAGLSMSAKALKLARELHTGETP